MVTKNDPIAKSRFTVVVVQNGSASEVTGLSLHCYSEFRCSLLIYCNEHIQLLKIIFSDQAKILYLLLTD